MKICGHLLIIWGIISSYSSLWVIRNLNSAPSQMLLMQFNTKIVIFRKKKYFRRFIFISSPKENQFLCMDGSLANIKSPSVSPQTMRVVAFSTNVVDIYQDWAWLLVFTGITVANCKDHRVLLFGSGSELHLTEVHGNRAKMSFEPGTALCQPVGKLLFGIVGSGCWQLNLSPCRLRLCHTGRSGLGRVIYFTRHFAQRQEKAIGAECQQLPALPIFSIWTGTTFRT